MNGQYITVTHIVKRSLELRPVRIFATGFVSVDLVELHTIELPGGVLVNTADSYIPELTWTRDTKETLGGYHQRIIFKPSNLVAAMWIQFAQAVTEELQMRRCDFCEEYFQVGPGAARDDARFCKDVCRVRAWVKRKNETESAAKSTNRTKKLAH